jgi:hypothetical protein
MNDQAPGVVRSGTSEQTAPHAQKSADDAPKRYAVYDLTFQKFLNVPTTTSKADADNLAKEAREASDVKGHKFEVREV